MKNTAATSDLPPLPAPPSDKAVRTLENELVQCLRAGLARAGIETGPRRHSTLIVELEDRIGIWVSAYDIDLRWWRITWGFAPDEPYPPLYDRCELTLHRDEFDEQTGVELARVLRDPDYRWPLFDGELRYPRYGWTVLARETYTELRLLREAHQERAGRRGGAR